MFLKLLKIIYPFIDLHLIPAKHNMLKDLYQSTKIVSSLKMNYEKIDACEKMHVILEGAQGRYQMYALQYVYIREGDK
jgi:hypothetical protein